MVWPGWALDFIDLARPYVEPLAVWRGYERELQTLAIYGVGIAIYTALVFAFYQTLSRQKPLHFHVSDKKGWRGYLGRFTERALVFPVVSFLYFTVIALALFVMAKSQGVEQILLLSMAIIVGVRVTVYWSEQMSNDLAKLVPLSLLAVILVDPGYITLEAAWARLVYATQLWPLLGRYFLLFIALEGVMGSVRWTWLKIHGRYLSWRKAHPKATFSVEVKEGAAPRSPLEAPTKTK